MSNDRNEGECYGPFHAGFVCRECADRIRALEDQVRKQMARAEKAEAKRDEARQRIDALRRQARNMAEANQSGDYCSADTALSVLAEAAFIEPFYFPQNAQERAAGRDSGGQKR